MISLQHYVKQTLDNLTTEEQAQINCLTVLDVTDEQILKLSERYQYKVFDVWLANKGAQTVLASPDSVFYRIDGARQQAMLAYWQEYRPDVPVMEEVGKKEQLESCFAELDHGISRKVEKKMRKKEEREGRWESAVDREAYVKRVIEHHMKGLFQETSSEEEEM